MFWQIKYWQISYAYIQIQNIIGGLIIADFIQKSPITKFTPRQYFVLYDIYIWEIINKVLSCNPSKNVSEQLFYAYYGHYIYAKNSKDQRMRLILGTLSIQMYKYDVN